MKKALAFVLAAVMSLSLAACGGSSTPAASAPAGSTAAPAGESYTINIGHGGAESTAQQVGCLALKDYLESHGNFTVNVYGNNSMGNDDELCQMVQGGNLEMCLANSIIVNYVPDAVVYDTFYNFEDIDAVKAKYMEDENFLSIMREKYAEAGFYLGGYSVHGFRVATANKALTCPDDLKGLTFRVMQNDLHIEAWQDMGATPTPFSFSELYTALQQGTVDGQENGIALTYSMGFNEIVKYMTYLPHIYDPYIVVMSKDAWNRLPADLQALMEEYGAKYCQYEREFNLQNEKDYMAEMEAKGLTVYYPTAEEKQLFVDATAGVEASVREKVGDELVDSFKAAVEAAAK